MVSRFFVPKFITIEDRLAGLLTFRQLFALLGAFLLTWIIFRANQFLGIIIGFISFGLALLLTFYYVNGKPFIYVLPQVLDYFLRGRRFKWQRIEKFVYKEIEVLEVEATTLLPSVKPRERKIVTNQAAVELEYPEVASNFREKVILSLNEPISTQAEEINRLVHRHLVNPKNPYRLFPYIKFYRSLK